MNLDLGRRALAAGMRWRAGMLTIAGNRVTYRPTPTAEGLVALRGHPWDEFVGGEDGAVPDLSDPATLGCLRADVVEQYERPVWIAPIANGVGWAVRQGEYGRVVGDGATEVEALVAALVAKR